MKKSWYEIENKSNNRVKIAIVGDIGEHGISASMFKAALDKHSDAEHLDFDIYSQGGNMYDGLYMFDYLSQHPAHKTARVVTIAASAATLPLMAMDVVNMPSNSKIMIHQPMANIHSANSDILRKVAGFMDEMQAVAIDIYQHKTKLNRNKLAEMINAETYMSAAEAKNLGFANAVLSPFAIKNHIDDVDLIESIRDLENYLRDAGGLSKSQATGIVAKAKTIMQREAGNDVQKQQLAELSARLERTADIVKKFKNLTT